MKMIRRTASWFQRGALAAAMLLAAANAAAAGAKLTPKEAKVGVYIAIINDESNHLVQNYDGYVNRVKDLQKGPTCTESGPQSWVSSMGPSAPQRVATYRKGLAKQPKLPADAAAMEMVDALDSLYKPDDEASEYYFLSKFKQDDCKRGRELHPILMSGWTKYIRAEHTVRAFLDQYTDERDAAELVTVQKKYGKALHYHQQKLMIDAKALIKVANAKAPDPSVVQPRLATFETTIGEAAVVVEKEKKGKNADALYQGGYEQLLTRAGWLKDATNELIRRLTNEAKDPKEAARSGGHATAMKNLITAYNSLVEQSNETMYSKTMK